MVPHFFRCWAYRTPAENPEEGSFEKSFVDDKTGGTGEFRYCFPQLDPAGFPECSSDDPDRWCWFPDYQIPPITFSLREWIKDQCCNANETRAACDVDLTACSAPRSPNVDPLALASTRVLRALGYWLLSARAADL